MAGRKVHLGRDIRAKAQETENSSVIRYMWENDEDENGDVERLNHEWSYMFC